MKVTILVLIFVVLAHTLNSFSLINLSTKNGAMCLDGSPAAIYTYQPDNSTKAQNKIIIMFQSTPNGWCFQQDLSSSLNNCLKFANNDWGSSKNYQSSFITMSGILSASVPGQFSNWYKVLIKSCDGGSFIGNRQAISLKTQKIYFRGSKIVEQTINYLNSKGWLQNRERLILVGSFNAGIAALQWSDTFQRYTTGKVSVITDSAYYLNELNYKHNSNTIQNRIQSLVKIVIVNIQPPHLKCNAACGQQNWRCFFLEELAKYYNFPIFFSQSLYDGFHIEQVLGFECAQLFTSLSECSKKDKQIIDQYHKAVVISLKNTIQFQPLNGGFGISCVAHELMGGKYSLDTFQVPMNSSNYLYKAIQLWINGESKVNWLDNVDWPYNDPCSKKIGKSNQLSSDVQ